MKQHILAVALATAAGGSGAAESIFKAPNDENSPAVVAAFAQICNQWADEHGLAGQAREAYVAQCRADMPATHPVGWDHSED